MRLATFALGSGLAVSACGDDGGSLSPPPTQLAFTVQPSASTAGHVIIPAVQVRVEDAAGAPVADADDAVTLALRSGSPGAILSGTTTVNAAAGVATFADLQISKSGTGYVLGASASGFPEVSSAAFDVAGVPGVPGTISPVDGDAQAARVGEPVPISPSVKVTDDFGDAVANVGVTFSVGSGGGSVTGADQTTDAAGVATLGLWTLGTVAGRQTLLATSAGLGGSPVGFAATATAGPAVAIAGHAGDSQTATVGTALPQPPSVLITDTYGNPVAEVAVTFKVTAGGGSVTGAEQMSGTDGIATVGSWTLGATAGRNELTATSGGLAGLPVPFSATAIAPRRTAIVEVRDDYFRSMQNGTGGVGGVFPGYAEDTVAVGGTVTWNWVGQNHNVSVALSGANLSGTHSAPFTYNRTFTSAGTFFYRCTNHSQVISYPIIQGMVGVVVVR